MVRRILVCIFFALAAGVLSGRERLHFNNISTDVGLSNKMVLSVAQDRDGFLWFGTAEGLDRYDGSEIRVFKHIPGDDSTLGSSWINCVYVTIEGTLLVASEMGLDVYNPDMETFSHFTPDNDRKHILSNLRVRCLYDDPDYIWAGTSEGLVCIDKDGGYMNFTKIVPSSEGDMVNEVKAITRDSRGRLWAGTFDGLFLLDSKGLPERRFDVRDYRPYDQKNNYISSLFVHPGDSMHLYVGTSNGLGILNLEDFSFECIRAENGGLCDNDIKCLGSYDENTLLIGTFNGLSAYNINDRTITNYTSSLIDGTSLPHETVWSICSDNLDVLWLGTGNGVAKTSRKRRSLDVFKVVSNEGGYLRDVMVNDVAETPWGEIWLGTNSGILVYDLSMNYLRSYSMQSSGLPHNTIKRLIVDSRGVIWAGTNDGITYFDKLAGRFVKVVPDIGNNMLKYVYDIKETSYGDIAVNISSGVCLIHPLTGSDERIMSCTYSTVKIDSIVASNNTDVTYMDTDKAGMIWFGTINDGLFSYNIPSGDIVQYCFSKEDNQSINSNRIYTVCVDDNGAVWVGTDMGLCRLDRNTGKFQRFADDIDLASSIRTLVTDARGRLWIGTLNKVIMYDYEFDSKIICDVGRDLDFSELAYNSFFRTKDGIIYLGGYGGVMKLSPDEVKINMDKAPVLLTSFSVWGSHIYPGQELSGRQVLASSVTRIDKIVLEHSQNSFSIRFALMNFLSESNNKYSYILHGYDKEWSNVDGNHSVASYSGIPPGRYTFEVKGANMDNIFSDKSASVDIRILSPLYLRWWAILLYVILGIILALVFLRMAATMFRLQSELKVEK
ncbi:MAG: two-component regulator propeller domain-containing protein, partial [Candidatus Cryptobacteroides sp.]